MMILTAASTYVTLYILLRKGSIYTHSSSTIYKLQDIKHSFSKDFYKKSPIFLDFLEIHLDYNHYHTKESMLEVHVINLEKPFKHCCSPVEDEQKHTQSHHAEPCNNTDNPKYYILFRSWYCRKHRIVHIVIS